MTTTTRLNVSSIAWCDFVLKTDKYIQQIYRDRKWWGLQLKKLGTFYFDALFPELACPQHKKHLTLSSNSLTSRLSFYHHSCGNTLYSLPCTSLLIANLVHSWADHKTTRLCNSITIAWVKSNLKKPQFWGSSLTWFHKIFFECPWNIVMWL